MPDNKEKDDLYLKLGVSSKKEEVRNAIKSLDKGLFPGAFCKIVEDVAGRKDYCSIFHSDGAGSKSSLAYMHYKEIGDVSVFRNLVRDAIVMNVDDILCVGATNKMFLSNIISRNSKRVSGEILSVIIDEYEKYTKKLFDLGLNVVMCGGETADLGDIVKTLTLDASIFTTMKKGQVIDATNIKNNDVILGLASFGKASYEEEYNSGIGSNGLTLARHGTLSHEYYKKYPEAFDQNSDEKYVFFGKHLLTEAIEKTNLTVGKALLSPTRTYAPVLIEILKKYRSDIHGIVHITGGGQTKTLNFGKGIKYVKNDLFKLPKIFEIIQRSSGTQWKEMYQVFNLGHRMEILCEESIANEVKKIAETYNLESKIIGHCEKSPQKNKNTLEIQSEYGSFIFN